MNDAPFLEGRSTKISSTLDVSVNYLLGEEDTCAVSYAAGKNASVPVVVRTFGEMERLFNTSSMKELYKTAKNEDILLIKEYILNSRIDADKLPFAVIAEDSWLNDAPFLEGRST